MRISDCSSDVCASDLWWFAGARASAAGMTHSGYDKGTSANQLSLRPLPRPAPPPPGRGPRLPDGARFADGPRLPLGALLLDGPRWSGAPAGRGLRAGAPARGGRFPGVEDGLPGPRFVSLGCA